MPSSSMRFTRLASEKRGGGSVKCWVAAMRRRSSGSFALMGGRRPLVLVAVVVLAFLIERQESVELHDLPGGAQVELGAGRRSRRSRRVVRSSSADSI